MCETFVCVHRELFQEYSEKKKKNRVSMAYLGSVSFFTFRKGASDDINYVSYFVVCHIRWYSEVSPRGV